MLAETAIDVYSSVLLWGLSDHRNAKTVRRGLKEALDAQEECGTLTM